MVQSPLLAHACCVFLETVTATRCSGGGDANDPGAQCDYICEKRAPYEAAKRVTMNSAFRPARTEQLILL